MVHIEYIGVNPVITYKIVQGALSPKVKREIVFTTAFSPITNGGSQRTIFRIFSDDQHQLNEVIKAVNALPERPMIVAMHAQFHNASTGAPPANALKEFDGKI